MCCGDDNFNLKDVVHSLHCSFLPRPRLCRVNTEGQQSIFGRCEGLSKSEEGAHEDGEALGTKSAWAHF